jgi:hypothetical protein
MIAPHTGQVTAGTSVACGMLDRTERWLMQPVSRALADKQTATRLRLWRAPTATGCYVDSPTPIRCAARGRATSSVSVRQRSKNKAKQRQLVKRKSQVNRHFGW